ncbi:MAG: sensor histidine kinase [Sphingomonadales bacterium]|nr:MAG: sensor histidine kinase [Sphingomonadales bacterium]
MTSSDPLIERFFANKARAFWILQIGGWLAYALLRFLSGLANQMGLDFVMPTLIGTLTGFSLTLIMAGLLRKIIAMSQPFVWLLSAITVVTFAAIFSAVEVWAVAAFYDPSWEPRGLRLLGAILTDGYVLTSWTALYFGINYYLMLRVQYARNTKLSAQAQMAQLRMLRYQLNPHFLFNTLNSISTLVLLRQAEQANAMLTRLSSFLRYTLAAEATEMVSVAQEVEALSLYLDIERMRFAERLRVTIDVSPDARVATLPSLLLQPLVENAIKYAVAPMENGADIVITVRTYGRRLTITVADTGPGMGKAPAVQGSSGVGHANIRERLTQAYGRDQLFEIRDNLPHGVVIRIELPHEVNAEVQEAAE